MLTTKMQSVRRNIKTFSKTKSPAKIFAGDLHSKFRKCYSFGRLKVFTIKTAILARVTASSGQNLPLPQPVEMPSTAIA